jgi:UDP-2,3-diacylglucosamine pyrophosphatase LpxH
LTDSAGWNLEAYTNAIVDAILNRPDNANAIGYLKAFKVRCSTIGVDVTFSYIIGNHDWLINRFPSARRKIANLVGLSSPPEDRFPEYSVFNDYGVLARHGDYYDKFNYDKNRDTSSLGDAIVIDLLNRFAVEVRQDKVLGKITEVVNRLKELDNVRPLLAMPAWIQGVCNEYHDIEEGLHEIWNRLVDNFFKIPFVESHGHFWPDSLTFLRMAMRLGSAFSFSRLREILGNHVASYWYGRSDDFRRCAYNEAALKSNIVKYVVYGHTHKAEQVPLDVVQIPKMNAIEKIYFNTGTWRKVFEQTCINEDKCEFIGWHVGTFVVFYLESEYEKERCYETWSGSLGYLR